MIVEIKGTVYNLNHYIKWQQAPHCIELIRYGGYIDRIEINDRADRDAAWDKIILATMPEKLEVTMEIPKIKAPAPSSRPCNVPRTFSPAETNVKVVAHIKQMRKRGETYQYIARKLNAEGVKTFSGKGEWHAQTVHRITK